MGKEQEGECQSFTATKPLPAKKILIIEDNPDVRRILTVTLGHLGYLILEAKDAAAGIKMSLAEIPDLILMDVSLPDSSGLETARKIKDNPKTNQIPIVACSGWKDEDILTKALEAGVVEFLTKPISPERLAELIEKLTRQISPAGMIR
jgi:two-component system, OmpR family, phosphate regulon response regulator PhoB